MFPLVQLSAYIIDEWGTMLRWYKKKKKNPAATASVASRHFKLTGGHDGGGQQAEHCVFFEQTASGNQVECRLCQAKLAYNNSTGSMLNHLWWKHPNKLEGETAAGIGATTTAIERDHKSPTCNRVHVG